MCAPSGVSKVTVSMRQLKERRGQPQTPDISVERRKQPQVRYIGVERRAGGEDRRSRQQRAVALKV